MMFILGFNRCLISFPVDWVIGRTIGDTNTAGYIFNFHPCFYTKEIDFRQMLCLISHVSNVFQEKLNQDYSYAFMVIPFSLDADEKDLIEKKINGTEENRGELLK